MQTHLINRAGEMEVFVRVVEEGGFSRAARRCGMTPSAVSKLISRLEARLGTRLFNRSTRELRLTPEGDSFYERSLAILADMEDAERQAGAGDRPSGRVRLNTSASYAVHVLLPVLPDFLAAYPDVSIDLVQTDAIVDLLRDRTDVAVRAGPLKDSALIARKLGSSPAVIVASPSYLAARGRPEKIEDLARHDLIGFGYKRALDGWPLLLEDGPEIMSVTGRTRASDGELVRQLAVAGVGLARVGGFTARADIEAGRLVPVLEHLHAGGSEDFYAVFTGQGGPLPARVRALLDFLVERGQVA